MKLFPSVCLTVILGLNSLALYATEENQPKFVTAPDEYKILKTRGSLRVGGYNVSMGPEGRNSSRFYAGIMISEGYKKKFSLSFRGHCDHVMTVNISIIDPKDAAYQAYLASKEFRDLKLEKPIDAMRNALIEQCPVLSVLKVVTTKIGWQAEVVNTMTLEKDKGWVNQDGDIATGYDALKQFTINFRDLNGMTVAYSGTCDKAIKLSMSHPKKGIREPFREAADYKGSMLTFLSNFSGHCPSISQVKIFPTTLPMNYNCNSPDECFVEFQKDGEWTVKQDNIKYIEPEAYTFDTILTQLTSSPAKQQVDDTYKLFFIEYVEHVSRLCPKIIKQPEERVMIYQTVDSEFGTRTETGRVEMTIDSRLVDEYLSFYDQRKAILFKRSVLYIARARDSSRKSGEMKMFDAYYDDVKKLDHHFDNGCNSTTVKDVYAAFSDKHL